MRTYFGILMLGAVLSAEPAFAQTAQPNAMMLAQANDRCMATYAVRMTKTDATDETIFADATAECKAIDDQLSVAIAKEYSAEQAKELTAMLSAQAKPNFMTMLQKMRTDRLNRTGN